MFIGCNENIDNVNILLGASFSCEAASEGGGYAAGAHVGRGGLVWLDLVYDYLPYYSDFLRRFWRYRIVNRYWTR